MDWIVVGYLIFHVTAGLLAVQGGKALANQSYWRWVWVGGMVLSEALAISCVILGLRNA
jgi:hypothetical protein